MDKDGTLAGQGRIHRELVSRFLDTEFVRRPLPKSADRYQFGFPDLGNLSPEDGAATLCAVTVGTVETAFSLLPTPPSSLYVCGGGSRNPVLMKMLRECLLDRWSCRVDGIESIGLRADSLEAECFAWLAVRAVRGLPTSLPETTGASRPVCGGQVTLPGCVAGQGPTSGDVELP